MTWHDDAACRGMPVAIWFEPIPSYESRARWLCHECPSRTVCLADAMDRGEMVGIRGGFTPAERMGLQPTFRRRKRRVVAEMRALSNVSTSNQFTKRKAS